MALTSARRSPPTTSTGWAGLVHVSEVGLDRFQRDEQPLRDLGVGLAGRGEGGDSELARRERVASPQFITSWTGACSAELLDGSAHQARSSTLPSLLESCRERLARFAPPAGPSERGAELDFASSVLESRW